MNAVNDKIVSEFRDAALEFFAPLAQKNGLRFLTTSLTEYSIPVNDLTIRVRLIPSHVPDPVVAIYSNAPKWLRESHLRLWGVNLLKFVQYQNENFNFSDERLSSKADLRIKMALLAELLAKYCEPLLCGDISMWQDIAKRAEEEISLKLGVPPTSF